MGVVAHYDVASHVPLEGSISFVDLAGQLSMDVERLTRVLRCTIAHNIFEESPPGSVRHTDFSLVLRERGARAWLSHHAEEMLPASAKLIDFMETYPKTESSKETAMSLAFPPHDRPKGYWEILEKEPWKVQRFSDGLEYATATGGNHDFRELVKVFDWKKFGAGTLVDVGGSSGRVCVAIAPLAPELKFIVQDLPEVEEAAAKAIPEELKGRVRFEAHDFFKPQPVVDAHVYLYRQILHDWPDREAIAILQALAPSLRNGDTVLLMEAVIPDPGQLPPHVERLVRSADLLMMAKHNSKERTLEMWKQLLMAADERFVVKNVTVNERCPEAGSLIEVQWVEA